MRPAASPELALHREDQRHLMVDLCHDLRSSEASWTGVICGHFAAEGGGAARRWIYMRYMPDPDTTGAMGPEDMAYMGDLYPSIRLKRGGQSSQSIRPD